jgi:hypothetical protein
LIMPSADASANTSRYQAGWCFKSTRASVQSCQRD